MRFGGREVIVVAAMAVATSASRLARACGASASGAGGVSACSLAEHGESARPKWRVGAGYAYSATAIRFGNWSADPASPARLSNDARVEQTRQAAFVTLDYLFTPEWAFEIGAGAITGGRLGSGTTEQEFRPGLLTSLGASWRVIDADGARPFVVLNWQLAFVTTSTRASSGAESPAGHYHALDLRLGATAGWPLLGFLTPYALGRVFGGPVWWKGPSDDLLGGDVHHFQIGAGLLGRIDRHLDVFVEGVPLGELGVSIGAGVLF
jgi:hypothetical protein